MKRHMRIALVVAAIALVAAHAWILYFAGSHWALSATALSAVVLPIVLKHLGFLGALLGWRSRRRDKVE
jgi:hypothetical protein